MRHPEIWKNSRRGLRVLIILFQNSFWSVFFHKCFCKRKGGKEKHFKGRGLCLKEMKTL